jgi:TetR/AcrR family transcriptional repressor of nem operon
MKAGKTPDTRLRIIQAAAGLFHKQGVRATSPDEVIEVTGTGKGQFYHYFKSKEGLVHAVLQNHLEAIKTGTAPLNYSIGSWRALERWFHAQIALQRSFGMTRGCPFGTIGNEVTENDELIRQDLNLIFEVIKNKLGAFFIQEKAKSRLSKDANPDRMADFCIATIQGAMLMGRIKRDSQPVEAIVQEALTHLKRYSTVTPRAAGGRPAGRSRPSRQ